MIVEFPSVEAAVAATTAPAIRPRSRCSTTPASATSASSRAWNSATPPVGLTKIADGPHSACPRETTRKPAQSSCSENEVPLGATFTGGARQPGGVAVAAPSTTLVVLRGDRGQLLHEHDDLPNPSSPTPLVAKPGMPVILIPFLTTQNSSLGCRSPKTSLRSAGSAAAPPTTSPTRRPARRDNSRSRASRRRARPPLPRWHPPPASEQPNDARSMPGAPG